MMQVDSRRKISVIDFIAKEWNDKAFKDYEDMMDNNDLHEDHRSR